MSFSAFLFSRRYIGEAAAWTVFLALAYWLVIPGVMSAIAWPWVFVSALLFHGLSGAPNVVWFTIVAIVVTIGAVRRRPAIAMAPVVLAVLCFVVSTAMRLDVQIKQSRGDWNPAIPADAKSYRTLIFDYWYEIRPNIVANHAVDRMVEVSRNSNTHEIEKIVETRLGKGGECSDEERRFSVDLMKAGRIDECYKRQRLDAIPDGLIIAYHYDIDHVHGQSGCCNASEVKRRDNGQETTLFAWRQGFARVFSYLPYYLVEPYERTGIWQAAAAPWQIVRYGRADIEVQTVAAAIYGADAMKPPKAADLPTEELLDKAEKLAAEPTGNTQAVMTLLNTVQERGGVNDRAIRVAASLIGHDPLDDNVKVFQRKLAPAQTEQLIADALDRIAAPGICQTCYGSATSWSMLDHVENTERYTDRARHIFEDRSDLALWQYEAALRIAIGRSLSTNPEYGPLRDELFQSVARDSSPAFGARAIAFKRVIHAHEPEYLEQQRAVVSKLDLVSDDLLEQFVSKFWGVTLSRDNLTPEHQEQATKICERAARIGDPQKRGLHGDVRC